MFKPAFRRNTETYEPESGNEQTPALETPQSANFFSFFGDENINNFEAESEQADFDASIEAEIEKFKNYVYDPNFVKSNDCNSTFWRKNTRKFPYLSKLCVILSAISSSSAFIERHFSVCGVISDKFPNIDDELFEMRCTMKTNLHLLNQMNQNLKV